MAEYSPKEPFGAEHRKIIARMTEENKVQAQPARTIGLSQGAIQELGQKAGGQLHLNLRINEATEATSSTCWDEPYAEQDSSEDMI